MRAYLLESHDIPPQLRDVPRPAPGPGEVRVAVRACGVNFADTLMIAGTYQSTPEPPFAPGLEIAGVIDAVGDGVTGLSPGDKVIACVASGGLAEFAVAPAAACLPLPGTMPWSVGAGFQIAYGTSHLALAHRARLKAGDTLLVLGAAGGVGLTAVELGHAMGARVIACARGADKLAIARRAGADHLIDSAGGDIRAEVKALGGADVVYDAVGGAQFEAAFRATRPGGRILVIGFASGDLPQIRANHLMVKNIDVIGVHWGAYRDFAPDVLMDSLRDLLTLYSEGRLSPHVSHEIPLERAGEALDLLRHRKATGKVVVTI